MKIKVPVLILLICLMSSVAIAQDYLQSEHRNFPIIVSLQFHSMTLPFRDLKTNFSNIGIGIGTEISLNGKDNWLQQFSVIWIQNKAVGNGLLLYTQPTWRPTITSNTYTELKIGAGYLIAKRPVESYKPVNGEWISAGNKGKGMFTIPAGLTFGYRDYSPSMYLSPFASYQLLLLKDYNQSIPVVPETLIQFGTRIHPKW